MRRSLIVAGLALWVAAGSGEAQEEAPPFQSEARVDAITGEEWGVQAGLGLSVPLGTYVRAGVVTGAGAGHGGFSGRTDLIARFTLDPFRDKRWAPYGVGGVSARYGSSSGMYMILMVGVEGPKIGTAAPAIEAGFGGGFRLGIILRQAFERRR